MNIIKNGRERRIPDEDSVKEALSKHIPNFYLAIEKAVKDVSDDEEGEISPSFRESLPDSVITSLITARAVHHLKEISDDYEDLIYKVKKNTTTFRVKDFEIKVKKLNSKNIAGYNHTRSSIRYCTQFELFNGEFTLKTRHLGYKLNAFGTLDNVLLACPVSKTRNEWAFSLSETQIDQNTQSDLFDAEFDKRLSTKPNRTTESKDVGTGT